MILKLDLAKFFTFQRNQMETSRLLFSVYDTTLNDITEESNNNVLALSF